ncbi:glycosyltransferase [Fulvimarina sp. 2208YS6-2-32]|uniref:Glycosyltransferase n=1 Tax=Fulvimarina uroteuthidis TaxID=3098149 RepID=A0ABU5I2I3_9HYPH|nr:glycosyltransferase [Fulvimarina sp. 2208YS6-2-32]MDY8109579.1 glycosyltransferase [Fulvimarina sp. 2208YS6-2-32]
MSIVEPPIATSDNVVSLRREGAPGIEQERAFWARLADTDEFPKPAPDFRDDVFTRQLLQKLNLAQRSLDEAETAARRNGTDIVAELIAGRALTAEDYAACAASVLGLPMERPEPSDIIISAGDNGRLPFARSLRTCNRLLEAKFFFDPRLERIGSVKKMLSDHPALARRCRVTTGAAIRQTLNAGDDGHRFERATLSLSRDRIEHSARIVLTGWQGAVIGASFFGAIWIVSTFLWTGVLVFHLAAALFFSAWIALRFAAAFGRHDAAVPVKEDRGPEALPVYTVVVALHREHEIVGQLVRNLEALNWPLSRLEIFLVCEADDRATIAPCRTLTRDKPQFHVLLVPPGHPRTKPKALNHVLPLARGRFLVLYDAEDEPHPDQLLEAFDRYAIGDERLACLQAPLIIRNADRNWRTGMFAMEYAGLFRALLPWLSRHRLPIPLGGTSNHFRTDILRQVGGWDSHNVTEDADLGIRLTRAGYGIATLRLPTCEDPPETLEVWIKQRTRWLKGWFQTYAVHMRNPLRVYRELGLKRFAVFQLTFHGMMSAALLLPFAILMMSYTAVSLAGSGWPPSLAADLLVMDLLILIGGMGSFVALTVRGSTFSELRKTVGALPLVPLYWLLVSAAAYRGLFQLVFEPHGWEKTPHGLASRADKRDPRHRTEPIFDFAEAG